MTGDLSEVRDWLLDLQERITAFLEDEDGAGRFREDAADRPGGGRSRTRVLEGSTVIERAAVNFSHVAGQSLPEAATQRRPELEGRAYEAASLSLIVHPRNPHAPTTHANLRAFRAVAAGQRDIVWFGGGFDLTPIYGYDEDAVHWHRTAKRALDPLGPELYPRMKRACDEYFFLSHRGEPRGIGGVFFDDFDEGGFERAFSIARAVGEAFEDAYRPILNRRKSTAYGPRERDFQLYRRGRYAEFNLLLDRGTRFGIQVGARTESVLASLPPQAAWRFDWSPEPGSPEERLYTRYLVPREWAEGPP